MKIYLIVVVLIFSFHSWTIADDIRDFEIEGISVDDNLFDFITKEEFEKNVEGSSIAYHKDNKFAELLLYKLPQFEVYDGVRVTWKPDDKNYKLYQVAGEIFFRKNFSDCEKKRKIIVDDISKTLSETKKIDRGKVIHAADKSGETYFNETYFSLGGLNVIRVYCVNWSSKLEKEKNYWDSLNVIISNEEFSNFLINEAYN